jgi:hypothetical protein
MARDPNRTLSRTGLFDDEIIRRRTRPRSPSPDGKPFFKPFNFARFKQTQNLCPPPVETLIHGCVYLNTFIRTAWQLADKRRSPLDETTRIRLKHLLFSHWTLSQQGVD